MSDELDRRFLLGGLAGAAGISALAAISKAGPLTPPAGAVAPTGKTLIDIEPRRAVNSTNTPPSASGLFRITQPGSYYLTGNIQGVTGRHGIEIASSGVTLDLSGFEMLGTAGMGAFDGIRVIGASTLRNIAIRNGSIRGWGAAGINLSVNLTQNTTVEHIAASENGGPGIIVYAASLLRSCISSGNDSAGIATGPACVLEACAAYNNGSSGFSIQIGCSVHGCVASGNNGTGISSSGSSVISGCTSDTNTSYGISAGLGGAVTSCTARENVAAQIVGSHGSTLRGNTCRGESTSSSSGIRFVGDDGFIDGNTCTLCATGMAIEGDRNRVEGNMIGNCGTGLSVTGTDNLVIRNSARSSSPNFSISAGNCVAPRVVVANSDGWSGITNANHPWANLSY